MADYNEFTQCQRLASMVYEEAQCQHNDRVRDNLMNSENPHKWWSTLNFAVFGAAPSLPSLISVRGGLMCDPAGKADYFDSKQPRDAVCLPPTLHHKPRLTSFAFRSKEMKKLLLDKDSYGGSDPLCMFSLFLFLMKTANVLSRISVIFRKLVRMGCFPACWRVANVTPIPKVRTSPFCSTVPSYICAL